MQQSQWPEPKVKALYGVASWHLVTVMDPGYSDKQVGGPVAERQRMAHSATAAFICLSFFLLLGQVYKVRKPTFGIIPVDQRRKKTCSIMKKPTVGLCIYWQ